MEQENRYYFFINDLIEHKKLILDCCQTMSKYLYKNGQHELSKEILRRAVVHDNSKLDEDEMEKFLELRIKDKPFKNANSMLSDFEKERIKIHWSKNRHHPEYFEDISQMEEIDIIEMVCDWAARSRQYGTDLIDFVKTRQKNRFNFPKEIYDKILFYCELLSNS